MLNCAALRQRQWRHLSVLWVWRLFCSWVSHWHKVKYFVCLSSVFTYCLNLAKKWMITKTNLISEHFLNNCSVKIACCYLQLPFVTEIRAITTFVHKKLRSFRIPSYWALKKCCENGRNFEYCKHVTCCVTKRTFFSCVCSLQLYRTAGVLLTNSYCSE